MDVREPCPDEVAALRPKQCYRPVLKKQQVGRVLNSGHEISRPNVLCATLTADNDQFLIKIIQPFSSVKPDILERKKQVMGSLSAIARAGSGALSHMGIE